MWGATIACRLFLYVQEIQIALSSWESQNSSISHFSNDPRPALTGWNTQTGQASGDQKACLIKGLCIGLQDKEMSAF